ncbi:UTRA domain-containing protein [Novosphingobium naphthalenivorans]|uniref:UTRA domain-containing protein n=1 Tax=Novosphingobium naphthalenivorans TaxID=273168 RepID=UPI000AA5F572|nr:UTRA domain-containing protein [Novosphingobium naphthalenivorans]
MRAPAWQSSPCASADGKSGERIGQIRDRVDHHMGAGLAKLAPGLLVVRTSLDQQGRVVEYDQEYWRHDSIRVHVDLTVKE